MVRSFKLVTVLLVTSLLSTMLYACSSNNKPSTTNSPGSTATEGQQGEDNSPITIEWYVAADWYSKQWDAENVLVDKMVTDATGISIKFSSGNEEKLSAMIASGQIPDVVTVWNIAPQRKILEDSGMVAPLDELIKQHAPDFEVPQSIQDWFRNQNGHFYGLPNYFYAEETMTEGVDTLATHVDLVARKDIMDQLGIKAEDFSTKEGTLEALRKVKDAKVKYNGFDIIPAYFDHTVLMELFGAPQEDKDGNWQDRVYTEESLEALKFLNQMYREGLLPEDSVILTTDQKKEKVNAGAVFAKTGSLVTWDGLYHSDNNAVYVPVGPFKSDKGNDYYFTPSPLSGWMYSMISSKSKYQDRIVKLFQYLSDDEMSLNTYWGPRGIAWDYDENGKVKLTEQRIADFEADPTAAKNKYGNDTFTWLLNWVPIKRTWPDPANEFDRINSEKERFFEQYAFNSLPFEATTVQGGTEEASIDAKLSDNRSKMVAEMVLAKDPNEVEVLFNKMIETDKALGFDKLYQYKNTRFQEAKANLGLEYAWPANQ